MLVLPFVLFVSIWLLYWAYAVLVVVVHPVSKQSMRVVSDFSRPSNHVTPPKQQLLTVSHLLEH